MLDLNDKIKLFDGIFERTKDDPEEWGAMAWTLRTAAVVLLEAYNETWDHSNGEPVHPENEHLDSPASMLYGCAFENMIKGYLIKKCGGFEKARAANQIAWDRHQLARLAESTGLHLSKEQKLVIRSLEAFVVWAGRYPISMRRDQFTIPKQWMSGDNITPNQIRSGGVAILQPFYKQLEDAVFTELREQCKDLNLSNKSGR